MSVSPSLLQGPFATVFDCGAFVGDFSRACLDAWPGSIAVAFEPLAGPTAVDPINDPRVHWYPVAVGNVIGRRGMWECEFLPSSSFLPMRDLHKQTFPYTRRNDRVTVTVDRLDSYTDLIREPALLKVDVQGFELEVLRGAGDALCRFQAVLLEVSWTDLYDGAPSWVEIDRYLGAHGFEHGRRVDEMPHPKTRAILQSDELWLR